MLAELAPADGGDVELPARPELPYFSPDARVTLMNLSSQQYLIAKNGVEGPGNQPDARAEDDSSRNLDAKGNKVNQVAPGAPTRIEGSNYTWCQPAPLLAPNAAGTDPKEMNLLWMLMYTGKCQPNHAPLYWIVSQDEQWVLSAFHVVDYVTFACMFPFDEAKKLRNVPSPTRWTGTYAVPPGRMVLPDLPDENSGHFRLYNPYCGGYLSEYELCNSRRQHWVTPPGYWFQNPADDQVEWVQDPDVLTAEGGPQFTRTMLYGETDQTLKSVFGNNGVPDPTAEKTQQNMYLTRCWLIQNRSKPTERKVFDELEHDYIQQWLKLHELTLQQAPPPN